MKLSKKLSKDYLAKKDVAFKPICSDFGIIIYELDVNAEYVVWGYSYEDTCHVSKVRYNYKTEDILFRVGHEYYNINDFYNVYGI